MMSTSLLSNEKGPRALLRAIWIAPLLLLGLTSIAQGQDPADSGVQVLTRGPVHEAFAEASMTGATAGVVIKQTPYEPITELPPDQRPEGANVAWIPGYWSWDDDRGDFIWVSGVWRDLPPGRQWVPGYWASVENGSQWISGFWGDVAQTEVTYLPPPPQPLEAGPSSPSPGPNNMWTSGCWVWQQTRYDWQPGYWVVQQPDWVWSPAHYTWTPRGYVYVPGYWDHDIVHRGVMFAPVYYDQPVYRRPDYHYSPTIVIDVAAILTSLFVQPRSNRYYFGDYYDARYEGRGIYPWHSRQVTRYGDDPIYVQYRARQLLQDAAWDTHIADQYRYRRNHVDARPPQTLALQINIFNTQKSGAPEDFIIGRSLVEAVQSKSTPLRFTPVNIDERKQIETRGRDVTKFQLERRRLETAPPAVEKATRARKTAQPERLQLPVSPVAARPTTNVEGARIPPPMPVTPKPQAVEGGRRQAKPSKVDAKTEAPAAQMRPEKSKPKSQTPRPASRGSRVSEPPRPQKEHNEATVPQTRSPKQSSPAEVESTREAPKVRARTPEVRSPKPASKTQSSRSDTKKGKNKQGQSSGKDDTENGKSGKSGKS